MLKHWSQEIRNIRDHLFVLNSVLHEVSERQHQVDLQIYDVRKCFDKMWGHETSNDMFETGVDNDQFVMIANSNKKCEVSVKTPWGSLCDKFTVDEVEMQGSVLAPLRCSLQVDTLGKQFMSDSQMMEQVYKYKNCVTIPPISMVDDILTVTECGVNSIKVNAAVQSKVDTKRLTLSEDKCAKMHFGKGINMCPYLKTHCSEMLSSKKQKYLGDIYTVDFKIDENIEMRHNKGIGIVNNIISIIKHISFGYFSFEIALILRNSLLINGILYNIETLFNLNQKHIKSLEDCDRYLWQQLFNCPRTASIEGFHIETNTMPIRFYIIGRKFMFLWNLLRKSSEELVKRVFQLQADFPTDKSWVSNVRKDLKNFNINYTFEELARFSKSQFKQLVSRKLGLASDTYLDLDAQITLVRIWLQIEETRKELL